MATIKNRPVEGSGITTLAVTATGFFSASSTRKSRPAPTPSVARPFRAHESACSKSFTSRTGLEFPWICNRPKSRSTRSA
jgi:hypothetical protein